MESNLNLSTTYEVVIVGGSFSGLSAAMSLGRSLRKVLIIDPGELWNRHIPHCHNFITHDGDSPSNILELTWKELEKYPSVEIIKGTVESTKKIDLDFEVTTTEDKTFRSKKILFCTGIKYLMLDIKGFMDCWGKSIYHCPYCQGFEFKDKKIAFISNPKVSEESILMMKQWTKNLVVLSNGNPLPVGLKAKFPNTEFYEEKITDFQNDGGQIKSIVFEGGGFAILEGAFIDLEIEQGCKIPESLGCLLDETGHLVIDEFNQTNIPNVYVAGDAATHFRSISMAVGTGNKAGVFINKDLVEDLIEITHIA